MRPPSAMLLAIPEKGSDTCGRGEMWWQVRRGGHSNLALHHPTSDSSPSKRRLSGRQSSDSDDRLPRWETSIRLDVNIEYKSKPCMDNNCLEHRLPNLIIFTIQLLESIHIENTIWWYQKKNFASYLPIEERKLQFRLDRYHSWTEPKEISSKSENHMTSLFFFFSFGCSFRSKWFLFLKFSQTLLLIVFRQVSK